MTVVLTAHQPLYLPWLGFFHKVAMSDTFCLWDDVQFAPNDFMHRNKIKTATGETWLTVPILMHGHREKMILDMHIDNTQVWGRKHWKSIYFNYKNAPYFESYCNFFEGVYDKKWDTIADLDEYLLRYLLKELGMSVKFLKASELAFEGKKSDRVLDMCVKLGASAYIFGQMGRDYANMADFEAKGIKVYFQEYKHPAYAQLYGEFISHLSVIDLLFNHGEKSYGLLMRDNLNRDELTKLLGI